MISVIKIIIGRKTRELLYSFLPCLFENRSYSPSSSYSCTELHILIGHFSHRRNETHENILKDILLMLRHIFGLIVQRCLLSIHALSHVGICPPETIGRRGGKWRTRDRPGGSVKSIRSVTPMGRAPSKWHVTSAR